MAAARRQGTAIALARAGMDARIKNSSAVARRDRASSERNTRGHQPSCTATELGNRRCPQQARQGSKTSSIERPQEVGPT